jgi:hypothetical protein
VVSVGTGEVLAILKEESIERMVQDHVREVGQIGFWWPSLFSTNLCKFEEDSNELSAFSKVVGYKIFKLFLKGRASWISKDQ